MSNLQFDKLSKRIEGYRNDMIEMQKKLIPFQAISPASGGKGEYQKGKFLESVLPQGFDTITPCHATQKEAEESVGASAARERLLKTLLAAVMLKSGTLTVISLPWAGNSFLIYPMVLALRTSWADAATTERARAPVIAIHNDFFISVLRSWLFKSMVRKQCSSLLLSKKIRESPIGVNT